MFPRPPIPMPRFDASDDELIATGAAIDARRQEIISDIKFAGALCAVFATVMTVMLVSAFIAM